MQVPEKAKSLKTRNRQIRNQQVAGSIPAGGSNKTKDLPENVK